MTATLPDFTKPETAPRERALRGALLGTAAADAFGLLREGIAPQRARKLYGAPQKMQFLFGRGFCSDDTEHAILTAQALLASRADDGASTRFEAARFQKVLARQLKLWIGTFPAGTGLATLRACLRLLRGVAPERSGVDSAGNGAAMRAAVLGVCCDDDAQLRELIEISSRLTHRDERAAQGAFAIALAARFNAERAAQNADFNGDARREYSRQLRAQLGDCELVALAEKAAESALRGESTTKFAAQMDWKNGVSGYVLHSVPAALHGWLRHGDDFRTAIIDVVECGGDTDTTAALCGGIIGAAVGAEGVPRDWLDALAEWPRDENWMNQLASRLAHACDGKAENAAPLPVSYLALLARNALFFCVVMAHGFRRLLPPY